MIADFFQPIRLLRENRRLRAKVKNQEEEAGKVSDAYHQVAHDAIRLSVERDNLKAEVVRLKEITQFFEAGKVPRVYISAPKQQKKKKEIDYQSFEGVRAAERPKETCKNCSGSDRRKESDAIQARTFCLKHDILCGKLGLCRDYQRERVA